MLAVVVSADGTPAACATVESPVATFAYPESAARALGRRRERAEWLRRPAGTVPPLDDVDRAGARAIVDAALATTDDVWLDPQRDPGLLDGLRRAARRRSCVAATADEAVAAADGSDCPVVVKTAAAGAHKTESGGVALDLQTTRRIRAAAERIGGPLLVQPMVRGGAELLAGIVQDPVFGPLVAFGPGGVLAELIGGAQFRIAPLTDVDARELVPAARPGGSSPASAARRRPTRTRSSTSCTGSRGSPRIFPRSPSST